MNRLKRADLDSGEVAELMVADYYYAVLIDSIMVAKVHSLALAEAVYYGWVGGKA